jgi:hypothetical protein
MYKRLKARPWPSSVLLIELRTADLLEIDRMTRLEQWGVSHPWTSALVIFAWN